MTDAAFVQPLARMLTMVAVALATISSVRTYAQQPAPGRVDACVVCHSRLDPQSPGRVAVERFHDDVHQARGFSCVDCHGGDASTDDAVRAKDPRRGYIGVPRGPAIVQMCARCHSDPELMRRFAPRQRVDQRAEYATSVHGQRLAAGDSRVATCVSCHSAHGIRLVTDAKSPVYSLNVATTCGTCHSDPERMKGYKLPDGSPLPTTQRPDYEKSAHHVALTRRGDLSAPTCNDCHGNHGAAPPGVGAIANVCGTCHAVFASRFASSPHREIFERGCVECHSNHAVLPTSDEMLGAAGQAVCATCHSTDDTGGKTAEQMRQSIDRLKTAVAHARALTAHVKNEGMEVSDQELAIAEAQTRLIVARTEIHSASLASVTPVIDDGLKIVAGAERADQSALSELRFRRRGLMASLAAILILVVALALKIRDLDRRDRVGKWSA